MLKLADNFAAFNQRLKYAHFRPLVSVKSNPSSWWKYAYRAVSDQLKKARYPKFYLSVYVMLSKIVYKQLELSSGEMETLACRIETRDHQE